MKTFTVGLELLTITYIYKYCCCSIFVSIRTCSYHCIRTKLHKMRTRILNGPKMYTYHGHDCLSTLRWLTLVFSNLNCLLWVSANCRQEIQSGRYLRGESVPYVNLQSTTLHDPYVSAVWVVRIGWTISFRCSPNFFFNVNAFFIIEFNSI